MSKEIPEIEKNKIKKQIVGNIESTEPPEMDAGLMQDELKQEQNDEREIQAVEKTLEHPTEKEKIIEKAGEERAGIFKRSMSVGIDMVPAVGEASMIVKGIIGKDYLTQEKLSGKERIVYIGIGVAGAALLFIPGVGEATEATRIGLVAGKSLGRGFLVGKSLKGLEGVAKITAKKSPALARTFERTAVLAKNNPKILARGEKYAEKRIAEFLKKNDPHKKNLTPAKTLGARISEKFRSFFGSNNKE